MYVNPAATQAAQDSSGSTSTSGSSNDMFMKLLMAQLKSQDPMDPVDPNQFVSQLVQFNSLNELQNMDGLLQQIAQTLSNAKATH